VERGEHNLHSNGSDFWTKSRLSAQLYFRDGASASQIDAFCCVLLSDLIVEKLGQKVAKRQIISFYFRDHCILCMHLVDGATAQCAVTDFTSRWNWVGHTPTKFPARAPTPVSVRWLATVEQSLITPQGQRPPLAVHFSIPNPCAIRIVSTRFPWPVAIGSSLLATHVIPRRSMYVVMLHRVPRETLTF
jgi:hypothetical protein